MIRSWEGANHIPSYYIIEDVVKHTGHLDGAKKTDELRVVERGLGWFRSHGFEAVFWVGSRTKLSHKRWCRIGRARFTFNGFPRSALPFGVPRQTSYDVICVMVKTHQNSSNSC